MKEMRLQHQSLLTGQSMSAQQEWMLSLQRHLASPERKSVCVWVCVGVCVCFNDIYMNKYKKVNCISKIMIIVFSHFDHFQKQ